MRDLLDAINRLDNALSEAAKRQAAYDLGTAIGTAIGTSSSLYRTPSQIDAMTVAEMDAWAASVGDSVYSTGL